MLKTVTITGADDATDPADLMHLSKQFPFVEWGILVSRRQMGSCRFPGKDWIDQFSHGSCLPESGVRIDAGET